jgi:hypothetical protein
MGIKVKAGKRSRKSPGDPTAKVIAALKAGKFDPRTTSEGSWESRCPAHEGDRHNLTITKADDGRALLYCQAHQCTTEKIVAALGLTLSDLFPDDDPGSGHANRNGTKGTRERRIYPTLEDAIGAVAHFEGKPAATWTYHDATGTEVAWVVRFDPAGRKKQYRPFHRVGGGFQVGDPVGSWPLYHLRELATARRVYLLEGEKCADLTQNLGLCATTTAHGAKSAHKSDLAPLAGREVVIVPDADAEGESYARSVVLLLANLDPRPTVKIVRLPGLTREGVDIADWLEAVPDSWGPDECRQELERLAEATKFENLEADEAEADDWPPLVLGEQPPVPPFPTDVFPPVVAEFVRTIAESVGCPEDFPGLAVLVVAGAAIGRSASLLLKRGYFASSALYGVAVGHPTSGKTPGMDPVIRPMIELDKRLHDAYKAARERFTEETAAYANIAKKAPKPPKPVKPVLESVAIENSTIEAVAALLAINPRGLLLARDELSAWVLSFDQYHGGGRGSDRQFWLSVLYGKPIRVDRKSHPELEPIRAACPFVSVLGGIPPEMLAAFQEKHGRDDGFIERLMIAIPNPTPRPKWSEEGIPDEVVEEWAQIIGRLRARPLATRTDGSQHPHTALFSAEAKSRWIAWYDAQIEETNRPEYDTSDLAADAKLADFAGRFVLILHLLELACDPTRGALEAIPAVRPAIVSSLSSSGVISGRTADVRAGNSPEASATQTPRQSLHGQGAAAPPSSRSVTSPRT